MQKCENQTPDGVVKIGPAKATCSIILEVTEHLRWVAILHNGGIVTNKHFQK